MTLLATLRGRESIGLDAIESVALMDRFDSKYVVPEAWLTHLVVAMKEHQVLTIDDHVTTTYNNLYFDTDEGQCLEDHTRGRNVRFKVRIRHYDNTGVAFLEVKLRDAHSKTTKHRVVRSNATAWDAPLTNDEWSFLATHIPHATDLKPCLQSSFERFTLAHLADGERITFDRNLAFKVPELDASLDRHWVRPVPHLAVVEWKQHRVNHQGQLIQAIRAQEGRRGPLGRTLRLSKFVLGHAHINPDRSVRSYRSALRDIARAEHYAANPTFAPQSLLR